MKAVIFFPHYLSKESGHLQMTPSWITVTLEQTLEGKYKSIKQHREGRNQWNRRSFQKNPGLVISKKLIS